ncbi:MAG: EAL domain-containing protein [Deferribacterales bacterium]
MTKFILLLNKPYAAPVITACFAVMMFAFFAGGAVPVILKGYSEKNRSITRKFIEERDYVTSDLLRALDMLNGMHFDEECGEDMLRAMRYAQFDATYIKDIGYSNNNQLLCTSGLGKLDKPFAEIPPNLVTKGNRSLWLNVPIKLYDFVKKGHVLKIDHYNTVFNLAEPLRNSKDYANVAFYMIQNNGEPFYIYGNKDITAEKWENGSGFGLHGMTMVYCSETSYICSVAYTSYLNVMNNERALLLGIVMLSMLSTIFLTRFFAEKLKNIRSLKCRFRYGMTEERVLCYYQPIVEIATKKIIGFEVLCRWTDFDGSVVTPDRFLPFVKELGRTAEFTEIVINKTYAELDDLIRRHKDMKMSFNIFPTDFDADIIDGMLRKYRLRFPESVVNLELTEDELIEIESVSECTDRLRSLGYRVSIDDFGTGYSSLSYLREIKVDFIKVDRSFVKEIQHGAIKANLIPNIAAIADSLGCQVIAEGIEFQEQIDYLSSFNVVYGQGYLFSRPCPAKDFEALFCGDTLC